MGNEDRILFFLIDPLLWEKYDRAVGPARAANLLRCLGDLQIKYHCRGQRSDHEDTLYSY